MTQINIFCMLIVILSRLFCTFFLSPLPSYDSRYVQNFTRVVQLKSKFMPELSRQPGADDVECHRKGGETGHKIKEIMAAIDWVSEK